MSDEKSVDLMMTGSIASIRDAIAESKVQPLSPNGAMPQQIRRFWRHPWFDSLQQLSHIVHIRNSEHIRMSTPE
jgi:hypothetical protein